MTVPFFCVFAAFVLIMFPRIFVVVAQARDAKGYDNNNPREQQSRLTGWGARAQAAHLNAFEAFAPFAAAVLVAHLGHADAKWSAILAVSFVVLRVLYTLAYLKDLSSVRSLIWFLGYSSTAALFLLPLFS